MAHWYAKLILRETFPALKIGETAMSVLEWVVVYTVT